MSIQQLTDSLFQAFLDKDLPKVMSLFADDAVLYDAHYPVPRMQGRAAIERGLAWGLGNLVKPGLSMRQAFYSGNAAVLEVDTAHELKGGMRLCFDQVFVVEARDGKITRLQSYLPHGPHGMMNVVATLTRWAWRLSGKLSAPPALPQPALHSFSRAANESSFGGECRRGAP